MALDGTIAPKEREAGGDRREVLLESLGKARQGRHPTHGRLGDPGRQGASPAFPYEGEKGLASHIGLAAALKRKPTVASYTVYFKHL